MGMFLMTLRGFRIDVDLHIDGPRCTKMVRGWVLLTDIWSEFRTFLFASMRDSVVDEFCGNNFRGPVTFPSRMTWGPDPKEVVLAEGSGSGFRMTGHHIYHGRQSKVAGRFLKADTVGKGCK